MHHTEGKTVQLPLGDASGPTPEGPTPEELLARVGSGDQEAFSQLYPVIAGPALGLARRVVRNEAQAEEVCQETLIEVWRSAARFDPDRGSAIAWTMTVAHRRAVDRVRSARAAADRDHKIAIRNYQTAFDEVSDEVESRLERAQVRRCLRTLTLVQQQSVLLAYYDGCTYRETAELLGAPLGTIKSRLRDGLIRLRDCLGEAGPGKSDTSRPRTAWSFGERRDGR